MTTALVPFTPNVCSLLPAKWISARTFPSKTNREPAIVEMIAAQARARPDAPAVVCANQVLSYAELDRRANRVANHLVSLGVKAETIVATCIHRSPESIISTLAIMKAGGAFLPLDPKHPIDRLKFMLNDAQPRVLITNRDSVDRLGDGSWSVIDINREKEFANDSMEAPIVKADPDQLAYIIYTSGSTGAPKGVEITRDSLANLVSWHSRTFAVTSRDRASHLAGVGFDASVWEVWPYLSAGASLCLPDDETRLSPALLRDWIVENEITISFLPTALAESVMILDWPETTALRYLLTGADALHHRPAGNLPFTVVNNYGPTECTVVATSGIVHPANLSDALPTIGRPIDNVDVYILDENLERVADGEEGEIYIGGIGVARGYLHRPGLTRENFIADPFRARTGARLYRTGDRARKLPNGDIAYLGRIDDQIKIRGYRIEPSEIEAAINRHPAVAASVVIAGSSNSSDQRLTAYLTMRNGTSPAATELREFLASLLPEYMLPSLFVKISALPLTNNGKVDRAALPKPTVENTLRDDEFIAPRSLIENKLSRMVGAVLKLDHVSVNDNFFLLGGHSLLGTQLIGKIRSAFGVDLAVRTLFDTSTIAELSAEIERLIVARIENMSEAETKTLLG